MRIEFINDFFNCIENERIEGEEKEMNELCPGCGKTPQFGEYQFGRPVYVCQNKRPDGSPCLWHHRKQDTGKRYKSEAEKESEEFYIKNVRNKVPKLQLWQITESGPVLIETIEYIKRDYQSYYKAYGTLRYKKEKGMKSKIRTQ